MKTTGQTLQETRIAKKLELDDVARITKIRPQFLSLLESDDYRRLPGGTVARGFIRNYAEFLGLNPSHLLAIFRRDFVENQLGQIVPRGMVEPVNNVSFWTPKATVLATVAMLFVLFGAYLIYQYRILTGPPALQLIKPTDNMTVSEKTIEIEGKTDPEATLSVNSQFVVLEKGGNFSLRLPLEPGENTIVIISKGKSGKSTEIIRRINLTNSP